MIVDVSGVVLTPGNGGKNCAGNGEHFDEQGNLIEYCCDECDFLLCCTYKCNCKNCDKEQCPNKE